MCSAPLTVSGGVSMEKTASRGLAPLNSVPPGFVPLSAAGSNLYYPGLFPPARPLLLDALKRRLERHRAGLAHAGPPERGRGAGIGTHGGQGSSSRAADAMRISHSSARTPSQGGWCDSPSVRMAAVTWSSRTARTPCARPARGRWRTDHWVMGPPCARPAVPPNAAQKTTKGQQVRISPSCGPKMLGYLRHAAGVGWTAGRQGR